MKRLAAAWCAAAACAALAAPVRLDDSLSPRQRIEVQPRWEFSDLRELTDDQLNALVAEVPSYEVRLRTAAYVGREASIYFVLPRTLKGLRSPTAMRLEWTTRGRFVSGKLLPGDRALVFRGKIDAPLINETLDLRIHIDGRHLDRGLEFEPFFEIDLER